MCGRLTLLIFRPLRNPKLLRNLSLTLLLQLKTVFLIKKVTSNTWLNTLKLKVSLVTWVTKSLLLLKVTRLLLFLTPNSPVNTWNTWPRDTWRKTKSEIGSDLLLLNKTNTNCNSTPSLKMKKKKTKNKLVSSLLSGFSFHFSLHQKVFFLICLIG